MTAPPPEGRNARSTWQRIADAIELPENPAVQIYGTIIAGALLAAESDRRETLAQVAGSVGLTLILLWLAHAYATSVGHRFGATGERVQTHFWRSLIHDLALLRGAFIPLGVLLLAGAAQASLSQAVTAALISAAVLVVLFEILAGLRGRLRPLEMVVQVVVSALIGVGVLALKVIVH